MTKDKQELIQKVEKIREFLCNYMEAPCDCKYGAGSVGKPYNGEDGGCPELYDVLTLLNMMTDEEYHNLSYRHIEAYINSYDNYRTERNIVRNNNVG